MKTPRFIERLKAFFGGYFWLPCPICGKKFGGHEDNGRLMTSWHTGKLVCLNCKEEADRRNQINMARNPPSYEKNDYIRGDYDETS